MLNLYVNNLITGTNPKDAVLQIYEHGKQILQEMSMNEREWGLNSVLERTKYAGLQIYKQGKQMFKEMLMN